MRCPHCHGIHPDNTNFCPVIGLVIERDELDGPPPAPPVPDPRVTIGAAALGVILILVGVFLLRGGISLPVTGANVSVGTSPTPTAFEGGGVSEPGTSTLTPDVVARPPTPTISHTLPPVNSDLDAWIAYAYGVENDSEIFLLQPSTGQVRQVTSNQYNDDAPSLLTRTNELIYASYRKDGWEIYLLDLDTQKETQLTHFDGQARFPEWSPGPGARKIIFEGRRDTSSGTQYSIWLYDVDSGKITNLSEGSADSRPQWSPDGSQVVFGRAMNDTNQNGRITTADNLSIYILNVSNQQLTRLTNDAGIDNYQYSWSPDGQWILFCSVRGDKNGDKVANLDDSRNLWLMRADGSDERELYLENKNVFSPSWSPSGAYIVYTVNRTNSTAEMWLYDMAAGTSSLLQSVGPILHTEFAVNTN